MTSTYESTIDMCVNSLMAQVRTFNEEQLQLLFNDNSRIEAMLTTLPQLATLISDRDTRLVMCKSLAESNLTMEPKYKEMHDKLSIAYKEFQLLLDEVEHLKAEVKMIEGESSLDTVSALLQAATQKVEDEGESWYDKSKSTFDFDLDSKLFAEQFYEGSVSVDEFVKGFYEKRVLYHTRKVKTDKINEQLRNQQFRPISEPIYPHPATGYRQIGANIYPVVPSSRNSYYN